MNLGDLPSGPGLLAAGVTGEVLVCVVDDDASFRRSLARLFRAARIPVEVFASAAEYLARPEFPGACCLVLDICMPELDGLELQKTLRNRSAQIVFLTGHGDVPMCAQAMRAGAVDFLTKPVDEEALLGAVRRAIDLSASARRSAWERDAARTLLDALTPREFEVLQGVLTGALNKQIAADLGAAEKTIKIHRGRVMQKLGVHSVAELIRLAHAAGVPVAPPAPESVRPSA